MSLAFHWETMAGKLTLDPYFKMNLDDYSDRCNAGTWLIDMFRSALYMDLYWLECNWGVLGFVLSTDSLCMQKQNMITKPIIDIRFADGENDGKQGELWENSCGGDIPLWGV